MHGCLHQEVVPHKAGHVRPVWGLGGGRGRGGPIGGLAQGGSGDIIQHLGRIPTPTRLPLISAAWNCTSDFIGAALNSPIGGLLFPAE